jgi:hypothetical protein
MLNGGRLTRAQRGGAAAHGRGAGRLKGVVRFVAAQCFSGPADSVPDLFLDEEDTSGISDGVLLHARMLCAALRGLGARDGGRRTARAASNPPCPLLRARVRFGLLIRSICIRN